MENLDLGDSSRIILPNVEQFAAGLDFASGERGFKIFEFTYEECKKNNIEHLHYDLKLDKEYCIPDQLEASDWHTDCAHYAESDSQTIASIEAYQTASSSGVSIAYDQTTDVAITVPMGPSDVSMSTQIQNKLGYGNSEECHEFTGKMRDGMRHASVFSATDNRWIVGLLDFDKDGKPLDYRTIMTGNFLGHLQKLESDCEQGKPDFGHRLHSASPSSPSACESSAFDIVSKFGTHYDTRARFGGKISQTTVYNSEEMTSTAAETIRKGSSFDLGVGFFKAGLDSTTESEQFEKLKRANKVYTYAVSRRSFSVRVERECFCFRCSRVSLEEIRLPQAPPNGVSRSQPVQQSSRT